MKKILDWFNKWEKDKVLHVLLSLVISLLAAVVVKLIGGDKFEVLGAAWFAGFVAGFGKEMYDEHVCKMSDSADWAADIIGTTIGTLIAFLLVV